MEESTTQVQGVKAKRSPLKAVLKFLPILLALGLGGGGVYYLAKTRPEVIGLPKGQAQIQAEIDILIADVGKLITLPTDETPTVAIVTDVDKVKEQPFFSNAQNGDKVLIYTNAKKAILYRPSEKRIVEVGAVNIKEDAGGAGNEVPAEVTPTFVPEPTNIPTPTTGAPGG